MTCDKCRKPIEEGQARYTAIEPNAFRHAACHYDLPDYAVPPAAVSIAACVEKGLITVNADGSLTGHQQPCKSGWGYIELKRLVEALWPDIAPAGVNFEEVIERARLGNIALQAMRRDDWRAAGLEVPSIESKIGA